MSIFALDELALDELAEVCAEVGRWNFFFPVPPLLVVGGVGSPITPLAIFGRE